MSIQEILFLIVIFLTNIIQAITGFAGTVLAMPVSLRLVGENVAKPVLNLAAILICAWIVIRHWREISWHDFFGMTLFVGIGFGLGYAIALIPLDKEILLKLYGLIVSLIAIVYMTTDLAHADIPHWLLLATLIFGGILHSLYVSGGPLIVIYAMKRFKDKNQFRATLSLMWIILNSIMFTTQAVSGLFNPHVWILVAIAFGVSIASYFIGKKLAHKLELEHFMKITYVLLFISGISLVV